MAGKKYALISVYNKAGIVRFARFLGEKEFTVLSTGGTAEALRADGIDVVDVATFTGFPEMMGGRVKTLHPNIHAAILARRDNKGDMAELVNRGIGSIDIVVCNLYPFQKTVESGASFEECMGNIDIGGVALIRAAAKNHGHVAVVTDPADYENVMRGIEGYEWGELYARRFGLATKAFDYVANYDADISNFFHEKDRGLRRVKH